MIKVCMILKKKRLLAKYWGGGLQPPHPPVATALDRV